MSLTKKVLETLPNNVKEVAFSVCTVPIEDLPGIKAVGIKFNGKKVMIKILKGLFIRSLCLST